MTALAHNHSPAIDGVSDCSYVKGAEDVDR